MIKYIFKENDEALEDSTGLHQNIEVMQTSLGTVPNKIWHQDYTQISNQGMTHTIFKTFFFFFKSKWGSSHHGSKPLLNVMGLLAFLIMINLKEKNMISSSMEH